MTLVASLQSKCDDTIGRDQIEAAATLGFDMIENNPSNVSSAFEILLKEVGTEIEFVNGIGSIVFLGQDFDKAKEALERSGTLTTFRDCVALLLKE